MRVYEIAKEIGVESKVVIKALNDLGVTVKSHANAVSDEDAARVRAALAKGAAAALAKPTPAKEEKAPAKAPAKAKEKKAAAPKAEPPPPAKPATPPPARPATPPTRPAAPPSRPTPQRPQAPGQRQPARRQAPPRRADRGRQPLRKPVPPPRPTGPIDVEDGITVKALAEKAMLRPAEIISGLIAQGVMASINQILTAEAAAKILEEKGLEARIVRADEELMGEVQEGKREDFAPRAPVVTIMGHVDHGKTLLLDAIRQTNVVDSEAGGITQHIGASEVEWRGHRILFIDTPGHEAFTRMRARGAQVTDLVVLVVAADDGIMPQTIEAISHARAADVPILVAINKIDKPEANVDRVKQQLLEHNLQPEDWGGDVVCVPVSAKQHRNLDDLLEMITLSADLLELRANPKVPARGTVLEAQLDRRRGPVATVLVQEGTLRQGDSLIAGVESGKIRAMSDSRGRPVREVGPASAVEVLGFSAVPAAGDAFRVVEEAAIARQVSEIRQGKQRRDTLSAGTRLTLEDLHSRIATGEKVKLPVVLKADAQGSVETLRDSLQKLSGDTVEVDIMHAGVGGVTETDVMLASASNAIIVAFNVRPERGVADAAEREGIDMRMYTVIYQLIDDVKLAMAGKLEPTYEEQALGAAEVRDTFRVPRSGTIAGCYVIQGKILRNSKVRLLRDSRIIYEGKVGSLRRFKDDVREVQQGYECGIGLENFNDVKVGDVIEAFEIKEIRPTL